MPLPISTAFLLFAIAMAISGAEVTAFVAAAFGLLIEVYRFVSSGFSE